MALLELRNVSFGYNALGGCAQKGRVTVLDGVQLAIEEGEFVAVLGYSGSGKTTLISLLAGLIQPDRGEIRMAGSSVSGPGRERGVVFQNYSLLPWLTVRENIQLAVDATFPERTETDRRNHTDRFIEMVHLANAAGKKPGELSGGMRQRVALARTLAMRPRVLLMDEPLSALDALTRATLQDEIIGIWEREKQTVILVTNDIDEALFLADRVVVLTAGPGATLGAEFRVPVVRPRVRKTWTKEAEVRRLKLEITRYLLSAECRGVGKRQEIEGAAA